jgi:hypothetical protein
MLEIKIINKNKREELLGFIHTHTHTHTHTLPQSQIKLNALYSFSFFTILLWEFINLKQQNIELPHFHLDKIIIFFPTINAVFFHLGNLVIDQEVLMNMATYMSSFIYSPP